MFSASFTAIFVLFSMLGTSAHTLDVSVWFPSPFGLSGRPLAAPVGESNGFLLFQVVLMFWVAFVVINIPFQHLECPSAYSTCPSGFQGHPSPQHRVLGLQHPGMSLHPHHDRFCPFQLCSMHSKRLSPPSMATAMVTSPTIHTADQRHAHSACLSFPHLRKHYDPNHSCWVNLFSTSFSTLCASPHSKSFNGVLPICLDTTLIQPFIQDLRGIAHWCLNTTSFS